MRRIAFPSNVIRFALQICGQDITGYWNRISGNVTAMFAQEDFEVASPVTEIH